jgi:diguanylate cyclase (GGDEF)-like protein
MEAGLPQNSAQAVIQSKTGYIWIGTQEGLVRFDGVSFTVFDRGSVPQMASNSVMALCEDHRGTLWAGLEEGGVLLYTDGVFKTLGPEQGLSGDRILSIYEDRRHRMWLGTDNAGLDCWEDGQVRVFTMRDGLPGNVVYTTFEDAEGSLWVGTNRGLARIRDGRVEAYPLPPAPGSPKNWYFAAAEDGEGALWVGTYRGLYRIKGGSVKILTKRDGLCSDDVYCLLYSSQEKALWVGTAEGVNRILGGRVEAFTQRQGLSSDIVESLCEDEEGSLWIGTSGGLDRLRDTKFVTIGTRDGLPKDVAISVMQSRDGSLWIATEGGGASRVKDGRIQNFSQRDGLAGKTVDTFCEARDGTLWLGVDVGGLVRWRNGRFEPYMSDKNQLVNTTITCLIEGDDGSLWVGTASGLCRVKDGKLIEYTKKDGYSGGSANCLLEDRSGTIWIGTDGNGLNAFSKGTFRVLTTKDGLSNDMVNALYEDGKGALWIGTSKGLCRLKEGRFTRWTLKEGLFNDSIFVILQDDGGSLWMSCNKGVFRVSLQSLEAVARGESPLLECQAYGRGDGMGSSECNGGLQPSGWKLHDGRLCFPTVKGVAIIDPARITINHQPPPVVLESMRVDGVPKLLGGSLKLSPGRHRIEFRFTALSLIAPERQRFRCRLSGFDSDWLDLGERRDVVYTGVPAGMHTFRVVACNNDGVWNTRGASVTFEQMPRFFETIWFMVICALVLLLAGVATVQIRTRRLRIRQARLEGLVEERTGQLAQANFELQERSFELERANRQLDQLSRQDDLTGIANRRHFEEAYDIEWRKARRLGIPLSLLMIDIDFFKPFNDTYGHHAGDECLKSVAAVLAGALHRAGDLVARYGGEEFVAVLAGQETAAAACMAEGLREKIEAMAIPTVASEVAKVVTVSIGVAAAKPGEAGAPAALLIAADKALYQAKRSGRNRISVSLS